MSDNFHVFFSNRVEALFKNLKNNLFTAHSHAFTRRMIVVPSPAMKSWLSLELAKNAEIGIAAGLEIGLIDESVSKLCALTAKDEYLSQKKRLPSNLDLAFALAVIIQQVIDNYQTMSLHEKPLWKPLLDYLKTSGGAPLNAKSERRLIALCSTLSDLFLKYGKYGKGMLEEWKEVNIDAWQPLLWNMLLKTYPSMCFYYQELNEASSGINKLKGKDLQLHLFSISFIPKIIHEFLIKASEWMPINYYLLSPCQVFWSDIKSDHESQRLQSMWKAKGISEPQQEALEDFLNERNPLLANFGRLGREMALCIEESPAQNFESYELPLSISNCEQYQSLLIDDTSFLGEDEEPSLLEMIQADLLMLRNPDPSDQISISSDDHSIEVHAACTRPREIEALHDRLLWIIDKHANDPEPITPGDILVMAPNIIEYAPFIKSIFGGSGEVLDFQVMDMSIPSKSAIARGFLHLLSLAGSRWEADKVFALFEFPAFQKKHGIDKEDLIWFKEWIRASGIRWGYTPEHRNEAIARDHAGKSIADDFPAGTWDFGLERVLSGLMIDASSLEDCGCGLLNVMPLEGVEVSQAGSLGKWIQLLHVLREDLVVLMNGSKLTLREWSGYLLCLCESYFSVNLSDKEDSEDIEGLEDKIQMIGGASKIVGEAKFSFQIVLRYLEGVLNDPSLSYREGHLNAVKFCSMLPMRALPAKVIVLIGMNEGAYPKMDITSSLNAMLGNDKANYCPGQTDFDRYLFLEALLSARKYFLLSYTNPIQEDGKERPPSILVQELLDYMDKGYERNGQKISMCNRYKHPFHGFDRIYYSGSKEGLVSYSLDNFRLAQMYYQSDKVPGHLFVPQFCIEDSEFKRCLDDTDERVIFIDLKDLSSFAKNPLKHYCNKTLGIWLDDDDKLSLKSDEHFELDHLQNHFITYASIKKPIEHVLETTVKQGSLPSGVFKILALEKIQNNVENLKDSLAEFQIGPDSVLFIECSDRCEKPLIDEQGRWLFPPLMLEHKDGYVVKITGNVGEICQKGYLIRSDNKEENILKNFPTYIVFLILRELYQLSIEPNMLFLKDGSMREISLSDPKKHLIDYLNYYFVGIRFISPLIPEWVSRIVNKENLDFDADLRSMIVDPFQPSYNDYAKWLLRSDAAFPNADLLLQSWKPYATSLFKDFLKEPKPKKSADKSNSVSE